MTTAFIIYLSLIFINGIIILIYYIPTIQRNLDINCANAYDTEFTPDLQHMHGKVIPFSEGRIFIEDKES